jgi:hypothetical protein
MVAAVTGRGCFLAAAICLAMALPVAAQDGAGCFGVSNLDQSDIDNFVAKPEVLLLIPDSFNMMARTRLLAGSSDKVLNPLLDVAAGATEQQMAAIGAGLGRAANTCLKPNPQFKLLIEKTVAERSVKDPRLAPLLAAFTRALGEGATAALGNAPSRAASGAPSIGNNGAIGLTGPGSDDGLGFDGTNSSDPPSYISRSGGGFSTVTVISVSATQPDT